MVKKGIKSLIEKIDENNGGKTIMENKNTKKEWKEIKFYYVNSELFNECGDQISSDYIDFGDDSIMLTSQPTQESKDNALDTIDWSCIKIEYLAIKKQIFNLVS
jgi:hypothetical protein